MGVEDGAGPETSLSVADGVFAHARRRMWVRVSPSTAREGPF